MDIKTKIGVIALSASIIIILAGYFLFFYSVARQNRMEKNSYNNRYPKAAKMTREQRREVNRLLSIDEQDIYN